MLTRPPSVVTLAALWVQLLLLLTGAHAQLIASTLPACAKTCAVLQQAQGSCESNPTAAGTCFCQSALLAPIKTSSNNLCAPACGAADWATIEAWYKSACANGGANLQTSTTTTAAGNNGAAGNNAATAAAAAATTSAPVSAGSSVNQNQTGSQWWSSHYQWVVMVLVLIIGFTAIGVGGRVWYRRYHKKVDGEIVDAAPETRAPDMGMWAPSRHSVHDFTNGGAAAAAAAADARDTRPESTLAPLPTRKGTLSKGKYREGSRPAMPARTPSQRLKAAMESVQM